MAQRLKAARELARMTKDRESEAQKERARATRRNAAKDDLEVALDAFYAEEKARAEWPCPPGWAGTPLEAEPEGVFAYVREKRLAKKPKMRDLDKTSVYKSTRGCKTTAETADALSYESLNPECAGPTDPSMESEKLVVCQFLRVFAAPLGFRDPPSVRQLDEMLRASHPALSLIHVALLRLVLESALEKYDNWVQRVQNPVGPRFYPSFDNLPGGVGWYMGMVDPFDAPKAGPGEEAAWRWHLGAETANEPNTVVGNDVERELLRRRRIARALKASLDDAQHDPALWQETFRTVLAMHDASYSGRRGSALMSLAGTSGDEMQQCRRLLSQMSLLVPDDIAAFESAPEVSARGSGGRRGTLAAVIDLIDGCPYTADEALEEEKAHGGRLTLATVRQRVQGFWYYQRPGGRGDLRRTPAACGCPTRAASSSRPSRRRSGGRPRDHRAPSGHPRSASTGSS